MSDIFVSYAREDADRVRNLVERLAQQGWSAWWDPNILPGARYAHTIDIELKRARCVLVVWSKTSAASEWVHDEAEDGRTRAAIVPVLIDDIPVPRRFRNIPAIDLSDWRGEESHRGLIYMLSALAVHVGGAPAPAKKPPPTRRQKRAALTYSVAALMCLAAIGAGAYWAANNPEQIAAARQSKIVADMFSAIDPSANGKQAPDPVDQAEPEQIIAEPEPIQAEGFGEPNDTRELATPLPFGETVSADIGIDRDIDVYRVETGESARNILTFRLDGASETLRPHMSVFDSEGVELVSAYDTNPGASLRRSYAAAPGATYFAAIEKFSVGIGAYRFTIENDDLHAAAESIEGIAEIEPNDDPESAFDLPWDAPILGHLHAGGDADLYRILTPADAPGQVRVRVRPYANDLSAHLTILNAERAQIEDRFSISGGAVVSLTFTPTPGAEYFVRVGGYSTRKIGDYVLDLHQIMPAPDPEFEPAPLPEPTP